MKVEIWSDIVCPFCYIGKRKFEKALEGFPGKDEVEIEWKSFQLDPTMDNQAGLSVHEYLGKRKGGTTADGKRMNEQMAAIAKEVGLEFNFDKAIINNTLLAHQLLHFAKTKGLQNQVKERVFKAYYTEGKDVSQIETLVQLAAELGLDEAETEKTLEENVFANEVLASQEQAREIGVQGVPFFVFNNKYAVSGAQDPEIFAQVLEKVWIEEKPTPISEEGAGFCTVDGVCA